MKSIRIKLICNICKKEYEVIPSRVKKSKTCSRKCAQKYAGRMQRTNKVKLECLNCNKKYNIIKSHSYNSKFCNIECKAEYQQNSQKGKNNTNFGNYKYTEEEYEKWIDYKKAVRSKSYRIYRKFKDKINPFNLKLGKWTYHLDHRYSIHDGFHNKVPVSLIANLKNLQILSYKKNLRKGTKSEIELCELATSAP